MTSQDSTRTNTNLNRHLIDVNTLLDAEFGNENIKGSIQNADDLGLANDGTVALSEI